LWENKNVRYNWKDLEDQISDPSSMVDIYLPLQAGSLTNKYKFV